MTKQSLTPNLQSPISNYWALVAILLIAAAFRFAAIGDAPPGWRDDELIEFDMDRRIVQGWRPLFIAEAEGHEPFYHYLHAATIALFGENRVGYKWLPFAFGVASVALTFALARRMFDARVAVLAAALMAISFWPVMYARLGLRHIGVVPLMLGAFCLLYPRPLTASKLQASKSKIPNSLAAGLLLGAALMTYFAGRALPLILAGFLAYLLVFHRAALRRVWLHDVAAIVLAVVIAAPMFVEIGRTPGAEKRTEVVGGPFIAALRGDLRPALETTLGTLGMFTFAGDPESLYNVPGRPVFDGLAGLCFYVGVLWCLVRIKQMGSGFALVWLLVGIAPAFVSVPAASFSHTIAAQPVVYMLAAYGAVEAVAWIANRAVGQQARAWSFGAVSLLLVTVSAALTLRDYFGAWAGDPFVRFQYHAPTRDIARWLDQEAAVTDVAIGTHPNYLSLDPLALELDLVREGVMARWFSPETTLLIPLNGVLIFSSTQAPGSDVHPWIESLRNESILRKLGSAPGGPEAYAVNSDIWQPIDPHGVLATFGDSIGLLGGGATETSAAPGDRVSVLTIWLLVKPPPASVLKSFVHVLDAQNQVVAGDDRFDVNVSSLRPGDYIGQFSSLTLPAGLASGRYQIEVGLYYPETGVRLTAADGGDRALINPIEVTAP
ncbi:MAG TPA: glycosyltransferase family 39 protein [Anaerolineae bacterium]|nr:glycosyltransferase family 39 protein [Anaerolineae bacterium]